MAIGLPVAASDAGGNRELVIHGRGGYLCPVGDASCVGGGVDPFGVGIHDRPSRWVSFNRRRVADRFTDDIMVEQSLALYASVFSAVTCAPATLRGQPITRR